VGDDAKQGIVQRGLEGVIAAKSGITHIDGQKGELLYRGYDIRDLALNCSFEEVAYLVWNGDLPNEEQLREFTMELKAHRALSVRTMALLRGYPITSPPMTLLRTAASTLGILDPRAESDAVHTNLSIAIEITARIATVIATYHRLRQKKEPIPPDPHLPFAANFLFTLFGERADELRERIFDKCLTLHIDHGFNASTFAARVTAATLSDIYSAITSAIGTLRGPLHGGANQKVMAMLQEIDRPERARDYVLNLLKQRKLVMGFGHRVYKTEDPRATLLRQWCRELGEHTGQTKWWEISKIIEDTMMEEKNLNCNVDFYSATVYHMIGIPEDFFTPVFAMTRMVGWTAHILEQYQDNRLIRPRAQYVGPRGRKAGAVRRAPRTKGQANRGAIDVPANSKTGPQQTGARLHCSGVSIPRGLAVGSHQPQPLIEVMLVAFQLQVLNLGDCHGPVDLRGLV